MEQDRIPCRRCLLNEMSPEGYFRSIYEYIESIPAEDKTPDSEYRRRLELCKECPSLLNGLCRECGCFVEVRAAKRRQRGPAVRARWEALP